MIVLSKSSVAFAENGGTASISVASPSPWEADCPDNWVILSRDGDYLTISADNNSSGDVRDAKITVKSASDNSEIKIQQAYSRSAVHLSLSASNEVNLDSEGENCIFTVVTNGKWKAESDAPWLTIACNEAKSTLTLSVAKNLGDHLSTTLTITSEKDNSTATRELAVSQISREENHYYQFLGSYGLFATNWYYGSKSLGIPGTGSYCIIEEKEYNKSVYLKNLFLDGTVIEATYDKIAGTLLIEMGRVCLTKQLSTNVTRYYYITKTNVDAKKFMGGSLTGTIGTGANEDGIVRKSVMLSGFEEDYRGLGLICSDVTTGQTGPLERAYISDLFYASKTIYLVDREGAETQTGVFEAAAAATGKEISEFNY